MTRTIVRPPSLGVYADRARPRGVRPPEPIRTDATVHSSDALARILGLTPPSGVFVAETTVTGLPAVTAAVDMVAHAVAQMLTAAQTFDAAGVELQSPNVVHRPFTLLGTTEFWQQAVAAAMMHGNYVAIGADFDDFGWPRQVVPVHPDAVGPPDVTTGFPIYRIGNREYRWDELVHVRHGAPVGTLWGCGVIARFRRALSGQLHEQNYGETSYRTGGIPSAVIALDAPEVPQSVQDGVYDDWETRTRGGRRPIVVPKTISVTPLSWSPHDAEFAESRKISVAEAALMCGLAPSDLEASIGAGGTLTYANLSDRQLSRVVQSFSPWMALFEEAWSDLLPGGQRVAGNVEALLRSSPMERFQLLKLGREIGVYTDDEIRDAERRPKLTDQDIPSEEETAA